MTPSPTDLAEIAAQTRQVYDQIAEAYAEASSFMPDNLRALVERTIVRAPGLRVLDIGAGAGRDMACFEAQGCTALGIDPSATMLAQARKRVQGRLVQASAEQLPFADGVFDMVWACASLLHLPKVEMPIALAEAYRVCTRGGVLTLSMKAGQGEGFEPNPYDVSAPTRFFARYSSQELAQLLIEAGFGEQIIITQATDPRGEQWVEITGTRR